jgi:hypothetical protein
VFVLIPYSLNSHDNTTTSDYDFPEVHEEVRQWFEEIGCEYEWQPVFISTIRDVITKIVEESKYKLCVVNIFSSYLSMNHFFNVMQVLNLCYGTELDGVPGPTVIKQLEVTISLGCQ